VQYLEYELLLNREFLDVLEDVIDSAKRRVYVATYIAALSDATKGIYYALAYKQKEGLDVKVVLNGASQESLKYNTVTADFLRSLGVRNIKLTSRFTHIKLYIVDDYFIIGSHNLSASSYLNRYEVSVMVRSREMSNRLSELFHDILLNEDAEPIIYRDVLKNGVYYEVAANTKVLRAIYDRVKYANERVKVLMYIATLANATKPLYRLLKEKEDEGLDVAVLLNGASKLPQGYNKPVADFLKELGLSRVLLSKRFIHAKLIVVDNFVILGSHNLTSSSVAGRLELSLAIESPNLANALDTISEELYREEEQRRSEE